MNTEWKFEFLPKDNGPIDFEAMEKSYLSPLIKSMASCMQDSVYHAEGDVWTHLKMVLNSLVSLKDYQILTDEEKSILFLATFFHDSGKPLTTKNDGEVISSKGHSVRGARLAREMIINWNSQKITDIPFHAREHICNLVLLHMLPVYLMEKESPLFNASSASMVVNNRLLATLSMADMDGRICPEEAKKIGKERIELFTLFCQESNCYELKKSFASDRARFRYFFERKGHPDYDYFEPINGNVIVMCGLQASGKDWVIDHKYPSWKKIGLDQMRTDLDLDFGDDEPKVILEAREKCKQLMREKTDFVFNATNLVKDIRTRWLSLFRQYRYHITIYYKERPLSIMLDANKKRENKVPQEVILEKVKKIDIPTLMECHDLILDVT